MTIESFNNAPYQINFNNNVWNRDPNLIWGNMSFFMKINGNSNCSRGYTGLAAHQNAYTTNKATYAFTLSLRFLLAATPVSMYWIIF
jgi:hypothetical protein